MNNEVVKGKEIDPVFCKAWLKKLKSPCGYCSKYDDCNSKCSAYSKWFSEYWSKMRIKYNSALNDYLSKRDF